MKVLVVEAELEVAGVVPLPAHGEVGIPLFFVQAAEVALARQSPS